MQEKVCRNVETIRACCYPLTYFTASLLNRFSIPQYVAHYEGALRNAESVANGKLSGSNAKGPTQAPKKRVTNTTLDKFLKKKKL